jgi:ABC-type polysaccharide/polyol phosphate export permease
MTALRLLWRHRALIAVLVRRELGARYRASALGYLWSLLNPLFLLIVYSVVFTTIFQPRAVGMDPYPLFLFTGLLPWLFLSGALLDASVTLVDNGPLLAKVVCPPEIFPAVTVISHLIHHLLAVPVLLVALIACAAFGDYTFPWTFVFLPLALVPWILTTGGLALAVAALSVHFRDLRDLIGHLLNLFFFASPIIYTLEGLPEWLRRILVLNPLASLVHVYRSAAFAGPLAAPDQWLLAMLVGIVSWWLGSTIFARMRETLVEAV